VLTSREGAARIEEVKQAAGSRNEIAMVLVDDPFRCFDATPIVAKCRELITVPAPYRLVVNVTGGATALQLAAQAVYREHRGPKKLLAVVDSRMVAEQREEPYQLGEVKGKSDGKNEKKYTFKTPGTVPAVFGTVLWPVLPLEREAVTFGLFYNLK
jgi:hypothetical protein